MVTFTINIPPMLAYIPYMDPMGEGNPEWYLMIFVGSSLSFSTPLEKRSKSQLQQT
jgi:hypothetical protein